MVRRRTLGRVAAVCLPPLEGQARPLGAQVPRTVGASDASLGEESRWHRRSGDGRVGSSPPGAETTQLVAGVGARSPLAPVAVQAAAPRAFLCQGSRAAG